MVDIPQDVTETNPDDERNIFEEADGDDDGLLTRDEIASWIIVNSPHGQAKGPSLEELNRVFQRDDKNSVSCVKT